jgi:hypothetical protein
MIYDAYVFLTYFESFLSHPVFKPKLNAHYMCAQEQVSTHTVQKWIWNNQSHKYSIIITQIMSLTKD